jgi:hypothetical protein
VEGLDPKKRQDKFVLKFFGAPSGNEDKQSAPKLPVLPAVITNMQDADE